MCNVEDIVEVECTFFLNFSRLLWSSPSSFIDGEFDDTLGAATSRWNDVLRLSPELPSNLESCLAWTLAEQ